MESAFSDIQRDDELRYVTRHFKDLQGLAMVPLWAVFVLLGTAEYAHAVSRRQVLELFACTLALALIWMSFAGRWYRRRYGLVTPRKERVPSQVLSILQTDPRPPVTSGWWFVVCVLLFALYLAPLFLRRPDGRLSGFGLLALAIFLLPKAFFAAGASLWVRGRRLLAMGGCAMIGVLHISFLLGRLDSWLYMGGAAMVLLLADLYDHWLLTHLLNERFAEGRDA